MNIIIDFVIVGIVAFCTWRGYKNGLIRGIFGVVAIVVAIFVANILATAYSGEFEGMLAPFVGGAVDKAIMEVMDPPEDSPIENKKRDIPEISFDALKLIGLSDSASELLSGEVGDDVPNVGRELTASVTGRLCSSLTFVAVFAIGFLLISIIFAVAGNLINLVFTLPGLSLVDRISGVLLGLLRGAAIVLALALILRYFSFWAPETIEKTHILKYMVNNNPIANILGI